MKNVLRFAALSLLISLGSMTRAFADTDPVIQPRSNITNISSLCYVKGGVVSATLGFAINDGPRSVLFRATGPSLSLFGVPNTATAPTIQVFNSKGETMPRPGGPIGMISKQAMEDGIELLGGFPITINTSEPLTTLNLDPGTYTVHITVQPGDEGLVLAEIYLW